MNIVSDVQCQLRNLPTHVREEASCAWAQDLNLGNCTYGVNTYRFMLELQNVLYSILLHQITVKHRQYDVTIDKHRDTHLLSIINP